MPGIEDAAVVVGLASIGAGLWMIWPALALIVVGALLMVLGLAIAWAGNRRQ